MFLYLATAIQHKKNIQYLLTHLTVTKMKQSEQYY